MSNTIKDLLRDLAIDAVTIADTQGETHPKVIAEKLVEEYHYRFKKEVGKYFELEDK